MGWCHISSTTKMLLRVSGDFPWKRTILLYDSGNLLCEIEFKWSMYQLITVRFLFSRKLMKWEVYKGKTPMMENSDVTD